VSIIPRNGHHPASADDLSAIYPVSKRVPQNPEYEVKTLYQTDGRGFGTTTTGMVDEKTGALFATGLYTPGLLRCKSFGHRESEGVVDEPPWTRPNFVMHSSEDSKFTFILCS
jgi:hypothetical protein